MSFLARQILPRSVKPTHYALSLRSHLDNFTFSGHSRISLQILETTDRIVLHAKELVIQSAFVQLIAGKTEQTYTSFYPHQPNSELSISPTSIQLDAKNDLCSLQLPSFLPAGSSAMLDFKFTGLHNDKLAGFYRSAYQDREGKEKFMAVTQFEPTEARRAFPCWDEPAIKATFDVELIVKKPLTALSNMNVVEEREDDANSDWKIVKFATTPIMSTYLVAFAVGDFDHIEAYTEAKHNGRQVCCRVYTPPGQAEQGRYALGICTKTLDMFAALFDIDYPLPKMDMLAVPDFDAGAMENWGLVTYRTVRLLYEEGKTSDSTKQSIAYVVCHELAHQWFGNLVTMEWWSELWLNEGFATWVGKYAVDKFYPEWDIWTQSVVDSVQHCMNLDSLRSSHPVQVEIESSEQVNQIFDAISYHKGSALIRMLSSSIGQETFFSGVRAYLKRHAYANASTENLWQALSEASGKDIVRYMDVWTKKIGYPVVSVTLNNDEKGFHVCQNRFLAGGEPKPEEDGTLWWLPLGLRSDISTSTLDLDLTTREGDYELPAFKDYWKLNGGVKGIYRVCYEPAHLKNLGAALLGQKVNDAADRVGLIADSLALTISGQSSCVNFIELAKCFKHESIYQVWMEVVGGINLLRSVWFEESEQVQKKLAQLQLELIKPTLNRLGWNDKDGESYSDTQLRSLVIGTAGLIGHDETIAEANKRFQQYIKGDTECLCPNLRGQVFSIVVRNGGEEEWEQMRELYEKAENIDEKMNLLTALGYAPTKELILRALDYSLSSNVRNQDVFRIFAVLGSNKKARYEVWSFFQKNCTEFYSRFSSSIGILAHIVRGSCSHFVKVEIADEVEAFFASRTEKERELIKMPLQQSLEKVKLHARWLEKSRQEVAEWADSNP